MKKKIETVVELVRQYLINWPAEDLDRAIRDIRIYVANKAGATVRE